jgi:hypothetical protein
MTSYLAFIALGDFEFHEGTSRGLPYYTAYDTSLGALLPVAKKNIELTSEITDFLATKFGPYPFDSIGGVATSGFTFAIETKLGRCMAPSSGRRRTRTWWWPTSRHTNGS